MKRAIIAAWLLLFVGARVGACSVSVNEPPMMSSRNVSFIALVGGKPRKGVKIEIYGHPWLRGIRHRFTLISDKDGAVTAPALSPGEYWIVASADLDLRADLALRVSSHYREKTSSFSLPLAVSRFPTFEQSLAAAERMPINKQVQKFRGIVGDQSGSPIPSVFINILLKDTEGKDHAGKLRSDANGRFSAHLAEGRHIAVLTAPGFITQFLLFEVQKAGEDGELRVVLQIAPSS